MIEIEKPPPSPPLTADLPPVRARFRATIDDFIVDEVPPERPPLPGAHLRVRIEKRGISTDEAARRIARRVSKDEQAIGFAGRKDAQGVTRQWLSVEGLQPDRAKEAVEDEDVRLLEVGPSATKLRVGELAGNRFEIRLRDCSPVDERRAREGLMRLSMQGVPNYFGAQRFGIRGDSHAVGRAILLGRAREAIALLLGRPRETDGDDQRAARAAFDRGELGEALRLLPGKFGPERRALESLLRGQSAETALGALPFRTRELYLSAHQASLFNRLLAERLKSGTFGALETGDIAWEHASGALLPVHDDAARARLAPRAKRLEISPSGPLYGHAAPRPSGPVGVRELEMLVAENLRYESWARPQGLSLRGARRPYRVPVAELATARDGDDFILRFRLGPGAYATTIIDELLKPEI